MVLANGRFLWLRLEASLTPDKTGHYLVLTDIDAYKRTESRLYNTEKLLTSLLDFAPVSIYITDTDNRLRLVNRQWENDTQINRATAIGKPLTAIFQEELAQKYQKDNQTVIVNGPHTSEEWTKTPAGHRCYQTIKFPLLDASGEATSVGGISIDITKRKELESELRRRASLAEFQAAIGAALVESGNLQQMLQQCAQIIVDAFDAALARIWVLDEAAEILELQASAGLHTHLDGKRGRVPLGTLQVGHIALGQLPHLSNDIIGDQIVDDPEWAQREGLVAFVGHPLLVEEQLVGTLVMFSTQPLTQEHLQVIGTIANNVALAIKRKRMKAEMHALAGRLTATLESITDSFFTVDKEWRFTYVNQETERIWQRDRDNLLGENLWQMFPPLVGTAFEEAYRRAQALQEAVFFEAFYPPLNRWFAVSAYPSADGLAVYLRDISQQKQHQREQKAVVTVSAALRQAEKQAEMLPIILEQLIVLLQADGAALALYETEGKTAVIKEAAGELRASKGLRLPLDKSITGQVITSGQPYLTSNLQQEEGLYRNDFFGDIKTAVCIPLMAQNDPIGVIWVGRQRPFTPGDIRLLTAIANMVANAIRRSSLHEQTQMQAEQIRQIVDSIPDGVLLLDEQHTLVLANPAARQQLSLLTDSQIGQPLTHLGDRPLTELLTSPPPGSWHNLVAGNNTFEAIARPLTARPTTTGWVMVLRDMTTKRLVQAQLQQQERLAAVGQLAAGIAHDFNNLMAVITLYSQLVAKSPDLSKRDQERLVTVNEQANHAVHMIQQILDFSRRSLLKRQTLDLRPFLKEQIKLLRHTLPEHIEIMWRDDGQQYLIQADPTRIQQAVMNLALNARDAMPDGGRLTISLAHVAAKDDQTKPVAVAPGEWVRLTVTDTGLGIAPEHQDHLFEPFFTTKPADKGTGLGLAQVHGIVAQHGGYITVKSDPGHFTTFHIYLPLLPTENNTITPKEVEINFSGQGELILVVEDDTLLQTALTDYLQMWGYRTISASNGEEALKLLQVEKEPVSLILSDVVMPRMGGINLFRALQAQGSQIPMILLTGHPLEEDMIATLRTEGLQIWLPKPPNLNQLAQAITKLLANG